MLEGSIAYRIDKLGYMMQSDLHLIEPSAVHEHLAEIAKYWSVLSDEDIEFVTKAQDCIDKGVEWV